MLTFHASEIPVPIQQFGTRFDHTVTRCPYDAKGNLLFGKGVGQAIDIAVRLIGKLPQAGRHPTEKGLQSPRRMRPAMRGANITTRPGFWNCCWENTARAMMPPMLCVTK